MINDLQRADAPSVIAEFRETLRRGLARLPVSPGAPPPDVSILPDGAVVHRAETGHGDDGGWRLDLELPDGVTAVVHGHSFTLWLGSGKIAEVIVDADAPLSIGHLRAQDARDSVALTGSGGTVTCTLRDSNFVTVDRGVAREDSGWSSFESARTLNYLLEVPASTPARLVVVFSAIGADHDFTYNYRSTVEPFDVIRCFILDDFGTKGSYYWLDHGDESIFTSVQELLRSLIESLGLDKRDVLFAGSSKGGTAALLHGVSLGVGKVLLGAPQYRVGDYLAGAAPRILNFMMGGASDVERGQLNVKATEILRRGDRSTIIRVGVGEADHHLKAHVEPLVEDAVAAGFDASALVFPGLPHSEIGRVFKHMLAAELVDWQAGRLQETVPYFVQRSGSTICIKCWPEKGEMVAAHVFSNKGLIRKLPYSSTADFQLDVGDISKKIRVRLFRRNISGEVKAFTSDWF